MARILFLDDDGQRHKLFGQASVGHQVDHAYTAETALDLLREHSYDLVYLDHDLGGPASENRLDDEAQDGRYVCRTLVGLPDKDFSAVKFVIHSMNFHGAMGMLRCLRDHGLNTETCVGAWKHSPDHVLAGWRR